MFAKPACADPFDMLISPEAVLSAIERTERLSQVRRRICRPLDARQEAAEAAAAAKAGADGSAASAPAHARPSHRLI